MALHNISFDDRDTDHISVGQTGTLSSSNAVTANLTFTFPTPASAFYYYGIPRSKGGLYAICVDCDPNNPNFIQIDGVDPTDNGQNPPIVLFSMQFEVPGVHEIILTNQADPRFDGNSQITLDRFDLQVGDPDAVTDSPTASIFATSAATPTTSPSKALSSSSTTSIVPIVAGVVGGVVLIAILALICILLRRRRKRSESNFLPTSELQYQYPPQVPSNLTQPYFLSQDPMMTQTQTSLTSSQAPLRHHHAPSQSLSSFTTMTTSSYRGPRRELDAGRVLSEDEEDEQPTLPPDYQEVFSAAPSRTTSLGGRTRSSSGSRTRSMASSSTNREPAYVFSPSRKS
ncbi:hypothetical protein C8J56DRAFT_327993 [Mycena floridula]|nr:hypothetical protein C8J56DRAFT_327993 [Mycena floridula]